ncbi:MAG: tetratricopeptide repeat protein, partial [Deltaproteobacteria bacterium]|nr:tetratricopeptide repeat protein [Deltaproteobacteria bacterium]
MAAEKVSRKKLLKEPDEFISTTGRVFKFVRTHRQQVLRYSLVCLVAVAVGVAVYFYFDWEQGKAVNVQAQGFQLYEDASRKTPNSAEEKETYKKALEKFKEASSIYGWGNTGQISKIYIGLCHLALQEYDPAAAAYASCLEGPLGAIARIGLAYSYEAKKDYGKAIENFEKDAEENNPYQEEGLLGAARCYERLNQKPKALELYQKALTRNPKSVLSGNEAIARGAWESGVKVASAYPGTPSTEILESLGVHKEVHVEWSPNEKVALEVGMGASFGGARSLVVMKHVGVNVAADPLFTLSYTGLRGGLVLVTADDPEMHSSQNEQDNRNYAKFAKVPMLEPADSQEAKDFTKEAFALSEKFDTPVMLRTTTRVSHSKSIVYLDEPIVPPVEPKLVKDPVKWVMLPANARTRHPIVEKRMKDLAAFAETFPGNRIEWGDTKIGIITSGISYQYAKEAMPGASFLKLAMVHPLPKEMIRSFSSRVKKLFVVEELDPFIEEQI